MTGSPKTATFNGFTIPIGADFDRTLTLKQDGVGIDIAGATIIMQVRDDTNSELIVELSTTNGKITLTDAPNGVFRMLLDKATP